MNRISDYNIMPNDTSNGVDLCECIHDLLNLTTNNSEDLNSDNFIISKAKDIEKYFVKTKPYREALKKLEISNIILFIGDSGSGKTNTSIMLATEYKKGYVLNFAEGSDLGYIEINNAIDNIMNKKSYTKKELFILDDFLGKTDFNLDEDVEKQYLKRITDLVKYVMENPNKKLILNSRITILENAKIKSNILKKCIENDVEIIDVSKLENIEEKCEILVRYIKKYNMENKVEILLKKEEELFKILKHENFSPFIIDRAVRSWSKDENKDVEKIFLDMLDNPDDVWENEIEVLNKYSKMYLNILYSLSDTWINQKYVNEAFENYINKEKIIYNENIEKTVQRLKVFLNFDKYGKICFLHPSIIDYLKKQLSVEDKKKIIENAIYFEQIERLDKEQIKLLYKNINKFVGLKVLPYTFLDSNSEMNSFIGIKFLHYMMEFKINVEREVIVVILKSILDYGRLFLIHCSSVIFKVLLMDYDFPEILDNENYMEMLFDYLDYEEFGILIEKLYAKSDSSIDFETLKPYVQRTILRKLDEVASEKVNQEIQDRLDDYVEEYFSELDDEEEFYYTDVAAEVVERIYYDIDIESDLNEIEMNYCKKYKIVNCHKEIENFEIEIDYDFVEEFIKDYK